MFLRKNRALLCPLQKFFPSAVGASSVTLAPSPCRLLGDAEDVRCAILAKESLLGSSLVGGIGIITGVCGFFVTFGWHVAVPVIEASHSNNGGGGDDEEDDDEN